MKFPFFVELVFVYTTLFITNINCFRDSCPKYDIKTSQIKIGLSHNLRSKHNMNTKLADGQNNQVGGDFWSQKLFGLAEAFGKYSNFNIRNNTFINQKISSEGKLAASDISLMIKNEYENIFFVTGNMDVTLWEDNCTFKDPFSSFGGDGSLKRFKSNADNLGKLVLAPKMKITNFSVEGNIVKVGWSFASKLNLPWKPVLAAAGETSHYISKTTGKIYLYEETWKSKPLDVVKRLFIPSRV